ncbi:MAG: hypothetical protein HZB99_03785 [Candidatus Harrisonbacteria bacterium]|nr:hypothetical protein [Candidatus Harrisonbacteria bacterium]
MGLNEEQLKNICKLGKGEVTCSFLGMIPGSGFSCLKGTPVEAIIWERRDSGKMSAKGDNCSGPPNFMSQKSDPK